MGLLAGVDRNKLRKMVDGGFNELFVSDNLRAQTLSGTGFFIDLVSIYKVTGFNIALCHWAGLSNSILKNILISVSNQQDGTDEVGCRLLIDPVPNDIFSYYSCTQGSGTLGDGLPTEIRFSEGRFVRFTFTESASIVHLCIREIHIHVFTQLN